MRTVEKNNFLPKSLKLEQEGLELIHYSAVEYNWGFDC